MFAPETDGWNLEYYFFFQDGNFSGFMLNFGGVWQLMGGVQWHWKNAGKGWLTCYIVSVKESSCQSILCFFFEKLYRLIDMFWLKVIFDMATVALVKYQCVVTHHQAAYLDKQGEAPASHGGQGFWYVFFVVTHAPNSFASADIPSLQLTTNIAPENWPSPQKKQVVLQQLFFRGCD